MAVGVIQFVLSFLYPCPIPHNLWQTIAALSSFFLAIALHPSVQHKAQKELDAILHNAERLPTFADRPSLPYIDALITELHRWGVVAPLGLPHCAIKEDVYEGWRIPKGTIIMTNAWYVFA